MSWIDTLIYKGIKIYFIIPLTTFAILFIIGWVFDKDLRDFMFLVGFWALFIVPSYVIYRIRQNTNQELATYEANEVVEECREELEEVLNMVDHIKQAGLRDGFYARLSSIGDNLRDLHFFIENWGDFCRNIRGRIEIKKLRKEGQLSSQINGLITLGAPLLSGLPRPIRTVKRLRKKKPS